MAALDFIGDIFGFIIKLCPHLAMVKTTDEAMKWVRGTDEVLLTHNNGMRKIFPQFKKSFPFVYWVRTGLHWYWPIVTELIVVPIRRQTCNLSEQYLTTKDGKSVGVGGILVWEVASTHKLLTMCEDYEDTMQDISLAVIKGVVTTQNFQWFIDNPKETDTMLTKAIRVELNRFGIKTVQFTLSDFCVIRPLGLWGMV